MVVSVAAIRKRFSTVLWPSQVRHRVGSHEAALTGADDAGLTSLRITVDVADVAASAAPTKASLMLTVFDDETRTFLGPTTETLRVEGLMEFLLSIWEIGINLDHDHNKVQKRNSFRSLTNKK